MENLSHSLVEDSIGKAIEENNGKTVIEVNKAVEEEVKQRTEMLQETFGDVANDIVRDATRETKSYLQTKEDILDPNAVVKQTKTDAVLNDGAAAYVDKTDNSKTFDSAAMGFDVDNAYWGRVEKHEDVHKVKQAAEYNRQELTYMDESGDVQQVDVVGTLTEWQATQENIDSDLTPDYKNHKKEGQEFADAVGEEKVEKALADGDMQALQDDIVEEAMAQQEREPEEELPPEFTETIEEEGYVEVAQNEEGDEVLVGSKAEAKEGQAALAA